MNIVQATQYAIDLGWMPALIFDDRKPATPCYCRLVRGADIREGWATEWKDAVDAAIKSDAVIIPTDAQIDAAAGDLV